MQWVEVGSRADACGSTRAGLRHVTILCSDIAGFADLTRQLGDREAARLAGRVLALQEMVLTRDGLGQVLQFGGDSVFAVFDQASVALNRALEIQRVLDPSGKEEPGCAWPRVRIGLHMGEVLVQEGERLEIISRHVQRAQRILEAAGPGQILASDVVVDAARDFIDLPREHQDLRHFGEYYLKGAGATGLCEVADRRFRIPEPPRPSGRQADTPLRAGLELAGYRPVARLGEGVVGVVFQAEQTASGKEVVVKVLNPVLGEEPGLRGRMGEEIERWQRLQIPGTGRVLEQHLDHQPPFLVMELVPGRPVDAALAGAPPDRVARVFQGICGVLERAQTSGVLHGDLKPENLLVGQGDSVTVLDFGLAGLVGRTAAGKAPAYLGSPAFLSPEILQGGSPTGASDVYALGVVLFQVLTGRAPFAGPTVYQVVQAHLHEDPPPPAVLNPAVADGLQRICLKALEKNPSDRYQTAREMREDLGRFLRGETVRTRPTVYDNLLFHRVQRHVEQIRDWNARGLLSAEESHRLLSAYEGLQRRGLPAVMEGRLFRFWQTLVYVGGWAVINGALFWLVEHWEHLSRPGKLLLGSVPALTTFTLAGAMWRLERFRLFFVALIVAVLATPLLVGVWLHEFQVAAAVVPERLGLELFRTRADSTALTNQQMLWTAAATLAVAAVVMRFTRTTTHSAQAALALVLAYTACLLGYGFRPAIEDEQWAGLALKYLPLLGAVLGFGAVLLRWEQRRYQAPPWIYLGALLVLAISYAIALHGIEEWTQLKPEASKPWSFLLLSAAGAVQAAIGLAGRSWLRHRCRVASLGLILAGLVAVLAGFGLAGWEGTWPEQWPALRWLGKAVPYPHVLLPLSALGITLLACYYQMLVFLLVGLAGVACSIHLLGRLYFQEVPAWPKLLMAVGTILFFVSLFRELRRTRGNTIDDVVGQARL